MTRVWSTLPKAVNVEIVVVVVVLVATGRYTTVKTNLTLVVPRVLRESHRDSHDEDPNRRGDISVRHDERGSSVDSRGLDRDAPLVTRIRKSRAFREQTEGIWGTYESAPAQRSQA